MRVRPPQATKELRWFSPHSQLLDVTQRVIERIKPTREGYLARIPHAQGKFPARGALSCANLARGFVA
ncbi:hypothetical protein BN2475_1390016 [Paraburkholderia ribeironis]|uniref:Uncharacterized protein n=1 Tax=Paraburkholderia ribeironis TaxID=1247936 RepID=A0A1N7SQ04_9BURK|nr:hypothetical protein BN2475_1390016 [Paraburkholderia ribeironis]